MSQQASRLKWWVAQVRKLTKNLNEVKRLLEEVRAGRQRLVKAPIVSLDTYRQIRQAEGLNKRSVAMAERELASAKALMDAESITAKVQIQKEKQESCQIIQFRRTP